MDMLLSSENQLFHFRAPATPETQFSEDELAKTEPSHFVLAEVLKWQPQQLSLLEPDKRPDRKTTNGLYPKTSFTNYVS